MERPKFEVTDSETGEVVTFKIKHDCSCSSLQISQLSTPARVTNP